MPPTTSFRLSRCCTLTVVNTSMPASSSSSTSCQRFGWREPGAFECASSSTRISAGPARQRGVEIEFGERPAAVVDAACAAGLPVPPAALRFRCGHGSRPRRPPRRGRRPAACARRQHRVGLADAGRGAEIDSQPAARGAALLLLHLGQQARPGRAVLSSLREHARIADNGLIDAMSAHLPRPAPDSAPAR